MSYREVRRKVVDISSPSYSYGNISKTPFGMQDKFNEIRQEKEQEQQALLSQLESIAQSDIDPELEQQMRSRPSSESYFVPEQGALAEKYKQVPTDSIAAKLSELYQTQVDYVKAAGKWGFRFYNPRVQKYIMPNEAMEGTEDLQVATPEAVHNCEPTAGEDAKLERTKGEKVEVEELGVGSPAEDGPTIESLRKQMEDLFKGPIDPKHDLSDDSTFHTATHLLDLEGTLRKLKYAFEKKNWDVVENILESLELYTASAQRRYDSSKVLKPEDSDIEATSLGEAIGLEWPKVE